MRFHFGIILKIGCWAKTRSLRYPMRFGQRLPVGNEKLRLRFQTATSNASFTNLALMCSAIDLPRIQINHARQVQPTFQDMDIGDVVEHGA